ncbi:MAG: ACP S-malonyltransferase [Symploca sp. SIO3C6]|uniref:Malonyl CoA-acyl carrier protein transacylase n=1 Tax=Symploca sp. SIO1C4 TaxID=2607765 RepID=A0A6B3N682_9CYAN|nr:ACP S-malonyltransferase [Symploca sp. SIO3C6]NER26132.1 ACP S-malonyltransferase [Symploca sp. SIO1C4]
MTKTAWVFPGQGSQEPGMGVDLLELASVKDKFEQAKEILGWSVIDVCQGKPDQLNQTLYTQPCLYVVESILVDLLIEQGKTPNLLAGHSLGEYVALYAAGVFDFDTGLRLVKRRAQLMDSASDGMMVALMKFDRQQLEQLIEQTPNVVLANDNSPAQVVISGKPEAVGEVVAQIKAKRSVTLKVSGAFHSPLIAPAADQFRKVLESVTFADAKWPILSNVEPLPTVEAALLKDRLQRQMTNSVRWQETSIQLQAQGIEQVVEIGPGKVLTSLIKRMCPEISLKNITSSAQLSS